ncbi:MAG: serine/threonine-protein kinase, partial [Acidobacteriota bacterium]
MTPERWRQVEAIFHRVVDASPGEREALLREECGGDPALAERVEGLVQAAGRSDAVFERRPTPPEESLAEPAPGGRRVGPYRLDRLIGQGGMGVVYQARHEDPDLDREVAIKLLHSPFASQRAQRRFRDEQRVLARLEHPNIARLYDGGVDADGRAYVVMERVHGLPITVHCDRRGLTVGERVALVEHVARVVQAVHQRLIIHRDLKPANILVTDDGGVKLLDFGIAKELDVERTHTKTPRALTLAYASPEHIRGESVSTESDVYSLGVVLYELLTGARPFSPSEVAASLASRPGLRGPAPLASSVAAAAEPSVATSRGCPRPATLGRQLRGNLDTILRKALAEDPAARYGTAAAFAADLANHRQGRPLSARPPSALYRLRCLVLRNRLVSASALLLVGILVAAAALLHVQNRQVRQQRDLAEQALIRAELAQTETESVVAFLDGVFLQADPSEALGKPVDVVTLLADGVRDQREVLAERPLHLARILTTVGRAFHGWGLFDEAAPFLEEAADLFRKHASVDHADRIESLALLSSLRREQGALEEAERLLDAHL